MRGAKRDCWGRGGGGGGGVLFMVLLKRCEEVERSSPGFSNFRAEKFSLQGANFRYCSENFVPAPALLLQNKNKNQNKRTEDIKEDFN